MRAVSAVEMDSLKSEQLYLENVVYMCMISNMSIIWILSLLSL